MKKTNVLPLNEIKSSDIQRINDYLEEAIKTLTKDLLASNDGAVIGLTASKAESNTISITQGIAFIGGLFAELESNISVEVALPTSGSKVYSVVAYYEEIEDMPSTGYVLLNVTSREEEIQTNYTRKFGAAKIAIFDTTPPANIASGYIDLAKVTATDTGITTVDTSVRVFAQAGRVGQVANQTDGGETGIQAARIATENMLLPLDGSKNFNIDSGMITAAGGTINGNFIINGTLIATRQEIEQSSEVGSNTLILNANIPSDQPPFSGDSGLVINRGNQNDSSLLWDETNERWKLTTGGLQVLDGGVGTTTGSFTDTVSVDKTNTKGILFGAASSGTRIFSTSNFADSVDLSSILTGLTSSSGITITGSGHARTIKNDGILSISATLPVIATTTNQATNLEINKATTEGLGVVQVGSGLAITSGGVVSNSDKGSEQKIFGKIKNSSGVDQFTASSNTDAIQFASGTGIGLAFDTINKRITYSNTGVIGANNGTGTTVSVSSGTLTVNLNTATTGAIGGLKLGNSNGTSLGTASPGTSTDTAARVDHIHPTTGLALTGSSNTFSGNQTFNNDILFSNSINHSIKPLASSTGVAGRSLDITAGDAGAGSNIAGGNLNFYAGKSTGLGVSEINFFVQRGNSSGTSPAAYIPAISIKGGTSGVGGTSCVEFFGRVTTGGLIAARGQWDEFDSVAIGALTGKGAVYFGENGSFETSIERESYGTLYLSGYMKQRNLPICRVYANASTSFSDSSEKIINMAAMDYSSYRLGGSSHFDIVPLNGATTHCIRVKTRGYYRISASVTWAYGANSTSRTANLKKGPLTAVAQSLFTEYLASSYMQKNGDSMITTKIDWMGFIDEDERIIVTGLSTGGSGVQIDTQKGTTYLEIQYIMPHGAVG